jgi:hypothetical protein
VVDIAVNLHGSSALAFEPPESTVPTEHLRAASDTLSRAATAKGNPDADAPDARDETLSAQAAVDRAEAKLIGACFSANSAAVEHWREVLDQAVVAYETATARDPRTTR